MTTAVDPTYYANTRPELVKAWRGPLGRVLDVGCGAGWLGCALLDAGAATSVVGVEVVEEAAALARARYDFVLVADIEASLARVVELAGRVDTVIFADVLEHLVDPWSVLRSVVESLRPSSRVLISLPNVASIEVTLPLMLGRFKYRESGILDKTHLRFFTRRSADEMLGDAGLEIEACNRTYPRRGRILGHHPFRLLGNRGTRQFIYSCRAR